MQNIMDQSTKKILLSVMFCFLAILGWGFSALFLNWSAYLDVTNALNVPLAISSILSAIGYAIEGIIFLCVWPQRPFEWIKLRSAGWSVVTGMLYSYGVFQYIISADEGIPASIAGPVTGLHVLIPPIWWFVYNKRCMTKQTAIGFILSFASLCLFSGLLSESISVDISLGQWSTIAQVTLAFGIAVITQDEGGKGTTFKQFPQVNGCICLGEVLVMVVCALCTSVSDITIRSNWILGTDELLTVYATFCAGLGTGFLTLSLNYTVDTNYIVALLSLYIVVPAIGGLTILGEAATWNILLGLFFAVAGMIVLALEAKGEITEINIDLISTKSSKSSFFSIPTWMKKMTGKLQNATQPQFYSTIP